MKGVSVIIPCYKAGGYVREAVNSVHAVSPQLPYEIIIVDDCSRDMATAIALNALSLTDPKVRIVEQSINKGQSAARNRAIEMAKYDYIMPLDADDKLNPRFPGYMEKSVRYLEDYLNMILVYSKSRFIGTRDQPNVNPQYDEASLLLRNMIPAYGIFRRSDALEVGGYKEDLRYAEDWEFWVRLHEEKLRSSAPRLVGHFREAHYLYRQHATGENVSVRQAMPMDRFFAQMTARNPQIYDYYFGTTDADKLADLREQVSSPLRVRFELARSATGHEFAEILWKKMKRMVSSKPVNDSAPEPKPRAVT